MRRWILALVATALVAFAAGVVFKPLLARLRSGDPADYPSKVMRVDQFRTLSSDADIVVVGDSYVEQGLWSEWLDGRVANRGIGQNTMADVLDRLDALPASSVAIVWVGINDLGRGRSPAETARATAAIVAQLDRPVILLSVPPTRRSRRQVDDLNEANRVACRAPCRFLDLTPALSKDGVLDEALTLDGVHLNGEGYRRVAARIRPLLPRVQPVER